ncbi:hypothetical protein V6N13_109125 [Hibiscus sabdariffa]
MKIKGVGIRYWNSQKLQYHVDLFTCRWPGLWNPPTQLHAEPRGATVENLVTCRARDLAGSEGPRYLQGTGSS